MSEPEPKHHSPVLFTYEGDGSEHVLGVPAREVRLEDWDQLEDIPKADLLAQAARKDGLYSRVKTVDQARAELKGKSKRTTQSDPDTRTPGRVDSDVVTPGVAVPPPDEPIGEGAPGFSQADTASPPSPQEG